MRHLRAADYVVMPWRNGGGVTHEIARDPAEGDFDWRLSMATVAEDGPFSIFPGVDRTLTVLTGAGIALCVEGMAPAELRPGMPFAFPGDRVAESRLLHGPVTDLNVMTRRGFCGHAVTRWRPEVATEVTGDAIFALAPFLLDGQEVARFDTLLRDAGESVTLPAEADILLIRLMREVGR